MNKNKECNMNHDDEIASLQKRINRIRGRSIVTRAASGMIQVLQEKMFVLRMQQKEEAQFNTTQ